jgi:hypothetical protein
MTLRLIPKHAEIIGRTGLELLLDAGEREESDPAYQPRALVKLFAPYRRITWTLAHIYYADQDYAWGIVDWGYGTPEMTDIPLHDLEEFRGGYDLPVMRDIFFAPGRLLAGAKPNGASSTLRNAA